MDRESEPLAAQQKIRSTWGRLRQKPIVGGLLVDLGDFVTFTLISPYAGPFLGGFMGWRLASIYGLSKGYRWLMILGTAVYCALPLTEFFPVATAVAVGARMLGLGRSKDSAAEI